MFDAVDGADFTGQSYFSRHAYLRLYGCVHIAGEDGADDGEVDGGVVDFQSAGNVEEYIFLGELEADAFLQYGKQHIHSPYVEAGGGALRISINGTAHQRLRLYQERADAFYGGSNGYAAHSLMVLGEKQFRRVAHLPQSVLPHLVDAQFGSASEAVLDAAQDAVHIMLVAFKLEYGVYDVFQHFGTGNASFLIDVTDKDYRRMRLFGKAQDRGGALPDLGYAARRGFERFR